VFDFGIGDGSFTVADSFSETLSAGVARCEADGCWQW
jgi:hypothetical protein